MIPCAIPGCGETFCPNPIIYYDSNETRRVAKIIGLGTQFILVSISFGMGWMIAKSLITIYNDAMPKETKLNENATLLAVCK